VESAGGFSLTGTKVYAPYANVADYILSLVRTDQSKQGSEEGLTLVIVENNQENIELVELESISPEALYEVKFSNKEVPAANLLGEAGNGFALSQDVLEMATGLQTVE